MSRVLFTIYLNIIGTNLASREFSVLAGRTQDLPPWLEQYSFPNTNLFVSKSLVRPNQCDLT